MDMTSRDNVLHWKRLCRVLVVILLLLLQVCSWSLPKSKSNLLLPLDFPLFRPFYKVVALSGPEEDHLSFTLRRQRVHLRDSDEGSAPYKRQLIEIDARNGSIWMVKRPRDIDVYVAAEKAGKNPQISLTATVLAGSSRTDLVLEFSAASFCRPPAACFPFSAGHYRVPEATEPGLELDYLQNLAYRDMCPDTEVEYQIVSDVGYLSINRSTGALLLSQPLDFEETPSISFNATCVVAGEDNTYATAGLVEVLDSNDNPPTTQEGNSTDTIVHHIRPGQTSLHFSVTAKDRDSLEEGGLSVRTEGDELRLFKVEDVKVYGGVGEGRETYTFLQAEIKSKGILKFPDKEYNFTVIIEDVKLKQQERQVTYNIVLINDTETELVLKDMYEVNISRNAVQYARILELSRSFVGYSFSLPKEGEGQFLDVTPNMGIVYVRDPGSIPAPPYTVRKEIAWEGAHERNWTILLVLNIEDDIPIYCDSSGPRWCSSNSDESSCLSSCGIKGSKYGLCSWRPGPLTGLVGPRPDFATCSPDLDSCPDGQCDELEALERTLCPQDCSKHFTGEVVPSASGRGLSAAVGPCHCPAPDHCTCVRHYPPPPAQMRRSGSTPAIIMEIYNETEKKHDFGTSSTLGPVAVLSEDGSGVCGVGCAVLVSSSVVVSLLIVLVVLWRVRWHSTKSGHVSLSGVRSDYVDEESRNTPSDTSSFGKTSMADGVGGRWEFPRSRLRLQCVLGEGEFGRVVKAHALDIQGTKGYTTVAVKMIKENGGTQEKQDLMMEFMLLKEISHPNVVRLLGASTGKGGPFYLIVEFAEMGSLRSYLRRRRRRNCCSSNSYPPPTYEEGRNAGVDYYYHQLPCSRLEPGHVYFHKEQLSFAWQTAKGMAYLADMKLVHRDLAARNILLTKQKVVKISDFGLSRDIYEGDAYLKKSRGRVPVKWMAIESLEDQIYTSRSDVWSFGVVLWEIMMQGASPYPGVTPQKLYNLLKAGYRMSQPDNCSDDMYSLMRQCWRMPPRDRPSFKDLVLKLELMLQDTVEYMDFVPKERYQRMHASREITTPKAPVIQYTSVLVENDEEEEEVVNSDQGENIGLVRLFTYCPPSASVTTKTHLLKGK